MATTNSRATPLSSLGARSPLGLTLGVRGWGWEGDLQEIVPIIMQNISLSVLTDQLSLHGNSTTSLQDTICRSNELQYTYNRVRLLATYGAGLALAIVCVTFGWFAMRSIGRQEVLEFSRILAAYPQGGQELSPETAVKALKDGRLEVESTSLQHCEEVLEEVVCVTSLGYDIA